MRRFACAVLCFLIPFSLYSQNRFSLNMGHTEAVNSIAGDQTSNVIYSVGDDGKLIIHDLENNRISLNRQISSLQIKKIIKHPVKPVIAIYETNNLNIHSLSVWDLSKDQKTYTHTFTEAPLFLSFSPKGTYIVYTTARWNSMTIVDSANGDILPVFDEGFGIVTSLFISDTEKTVVAYSPSGRIYYIDLQTGEQKSENPVATENELNHVLFHNKGRFLVGVKNNELMLVDIVNGKVIDKSPVGDIQSLSLHENDIFAYIRQGRHHALKKLVIAHNVLREAITNDSNIPAAYSVYLTPDKAVLSGISGHIYTYDKKTLAPVPYNLYYPERIRYFACRDNSLFFLREGELLRLSRDFSSLEKVLDQSGIMGFHLTEYLSLFWNSRHELFSFSHDGKDISKVITLKEGIRAISSFNTVLSVLDNNGSLYVFPLLQSDKPLIYPTKGLNTLAMTDDTYIYGGRNVGGTFNTPLVQINSATGEIIGIENRDRMIVQLTYDPTTSSLYSLGVQERRGRAQYTVISELSGQKFTQSRPMAAFRGIDNTISFAVDPHGSRFFTSTGSEGVQMYSWEGYTSLDNAGHLVANLLVGDVYVVALNTDYSFSFWNKNSGKFVADLYIISREEILVTMKDETFYTNSDRSDLFQYYDKNNRPTRTRSSYQRKTPF